MTQDEAHQRADTIMSLFWDNFLKSESAFIMRGVIAIALEDVARKELKGDEPKSRSPTEKALDALHHAGWSDLVLDVFDRSGLKIVEK